MWALGLTDNNITHNLANRNFSNDVGIMVLLDNNERGIYYLTSPHLAGLSEEEYEKAYYKAISFTRLINGFLLLEGDYLLVPDNYLTKFDTNSKPLYKGREVYGRTLLEYEQLKNPYEDVEIKDLLRESYIGDCLKLAKDDITVRDVIINLYLSHRDNLYFLVNAYKIYELILNDLSIPRNEKVYKNMRGELKGDLVHYLDYFITGDFTYYANTVLGSGGAGIFSRHGASKDRYNKEPLDLDEIDLNLRNLINQWLFQKIENRFGTKYEGKYEPQNNGFGSLDDADFSYIFDFANTNESDNK